MNTSALIPSAIIVGAGAGYAGARFALSTSARAAEPDGVGATELALLRAEIAALRSEQSAGSKTPLELQPASASSARIPLGEIDAAVARWMERNGAPTAAAGSPEETAAAAIEDRGAQEILDEILASGLWSDGGDELWEELRERGLIDEAIALLEQQAELWPNDPDARVDLAAAYIAKIQDVPQGPQSGMWAMKADGAYDAALELDEEHWNARFGKATALSFWPPLFGKQGEAIQNFEVLIAQQQKQPAADHHAMTYVFLGNLYQQSGEGDKALELWKKGAGLFPSNAELAAKLEAFAGE